MNASLSGLLAAQSWPCVGLTTGYLLRSAARTLPLVAQISHQAFWESGVLTAAIPGELAPPPAPHVPLQQRGGEGR